MKCIMIRSEMNRRARRKAAGAHCHRKCSPLLRTNDQQGE